MSSLPLGHLQVRVGLIYAPRKDALIPCIKCEKKDGNFEHVSVERPPYYSYMDSTSGQLEPASGARASIPGQEYWPEGTASRVRAARSPAPTGESAGAPSYGKSPGSRRRKYKTSAAKPEASGAATDESVEKPEASGAVTEESVESSDPAAAETSDDASEESRDLSSEFVVYQPELEKEELSGYDLDKKLGRPHAFIDPKKKKPIEEPLTVKNYEKEQWSRWQRRKPDVETVFLKAMAETGQVKLYGKEPTLTETSLYRARRHLFKEERLQAEQERLEKEGPMAYYSEWVKAWKRDTSREAIQKYFEETGEDENSQLIEMFCHQTDREFRIMMGTDVRIRRDPLAMSMREDQIKQIWGGDPVYPTVNYIQDPDQITDMDEAMARAVDIGENDDESKESEAESDDNAEEKITRNWSVLRSNPELQKSKQKPKKDDPLCLEEAIDDSENLTDFLLDFDEDQ
ncbi:hypothetical protein RJ641_001765 [Dillenia turbinata]|uniref:Uncharacterized protein n=1 Tax=Dillenia turbinata TaxID=194707 RepID=A0AAN8VLX3_9MAGN